MWVCMEDFSSTLVRKMLDAFVELLYSGLGKCSYLVQAHSRNTSLETPSLSDPMFHNESSICYLSYHTEHKSYMADRDDAWNGLMRTSVGGNAQMCLIMCSCMLLSALV